MCFYYIDYINQYLYVYKQLKKSNPVQINCVTAGCLSENPDLASCEIYLFDFFSLEG